MSTVDEIVAQALELPESQRAELTRRLILSLEPAATDRDPGYESAWKTEIESRMQAVEEGRGRLFSHEEAEAQIRSAINKSS